MLFINSIVTSKFSFKFSHCFNIFNSLIVYKFSLWTSFWFCFFNFNIGGSVPIFSLLNGLSIWNSYLLFRSGGGIAIFVKDSLFKFNKKLFNIVNVSSLVLVGFGDINYSTCLRFGQNWFYGIKPRVNGIGMNPVDHKNGGRNHSKKLFNKWGILAKK